MINQLFIAKNEKEAVSYVKKGAVILAGGTEVNRLDSSVKASSLVSIGRISSLDTVEKAEFNRKKYIKIGSMCTFQEAVENKKVPDYLKQSCLWMSSRTRRNMATLGGNIASLRDDSYLWPVLLAVKAVFELMSTTGRKTAVEASEYLSKADKYKSYLILSVLIPSGKVNVACKRYSNTASSHGFITMAICRKNDDYSIGVCVKNSGIFSADSLDFISAIPVKDDIFGSKKYKKYLLQITEEDLVGSIGGEK